MVGKAQVSVVVGELPNCMFSCSMMLTRLKSSWGSQEKHNWMNRTKTREGSLINWILCSEVGQARLCLRESTSPGTKRRERGLQWVRWALSKATVCRRCSEVWDQFKWLHRCYMGERHFVPWETRKQRPGAKQNEPFPGAENSFLVMLPVSIALTVVVGERGCLSFSSFSILPCCVVQDSHLVPEEADTQLIWGDA